MEWNEYRNAFSEAAKENGKSENYCEEYLNYANKIWMHNRPVIYNQDHLCRI